MSNVRVLWDAGGTPKRGGDLPPPPDGGAGQVDPWEDAPFTPLGKSGSRYFFLDYKGEIIDLPDVALGQWPRIVGLCGGNHDWLSAHWPSFDKDGTKTEWFNVRAAGSAVMRRCNAMDLFDLTEPRRRYGLWPVPGGHALHLGDVVLWDGAARKAGFRDAAALWPTLPRRPKPAAGDKIAGASLGFELQRKLASWNWEHPDSPAVMLGLIAVGMLGAGAPWRAHALVIGEPGCGKTTLLQGFIAGLCPLTRYQNDYTEPGLRQIMSETAAGVILDEAEGDGYVDLKLQRVIEMLRRASSGTGVQAVKGGENQTAKTFTVTAAAILGAVLPPPMTPQDESRFTVLTMRPLKPMAGEAETDDALAAWSALHGPAIWGRVIANVGRVNVLFRLLRRRLMDRGCSSRVADQLGMIAAARWVVVADPAEDPASHDIEDDPDLVLRPVGWLIVKDEDQIADSGPAQALQRLLSTTMDMQGDKLTIGQALHALQQSATTLKKLGSSPVDILDREERDKAIAAHNKFTHLLEQSGVKWARHPLRGPDDAPEPPPLGLYINVQAHPRLARAYEGTAWSGQRWGTSLARLPGAKGSREVGSVRMAGAKPRCCWVPHDTLRALTA